MTDEELDAFVAEANEELQQKQDELQFKYGIGAAARWSFDQAIGKLQFFDHDDRLAIEADVVLLGSYSPLSRSWKWSWANPSLLPHLRKPSFRVRELEEKTGLGVFGEEAAFSIAAEGEAWELVAMAVHHLRALGCYRGPSSAKDGPWTFFAITTVTATAQQASAGPVS